MNLPHYESVLQYSSLVSWTIPFLFGAYRGLSKKSGSILLFASMSGLTFWLATMIQLYAGIWNDLYLVARENEPLRAHGANGAANAFASIFGWLPGLLLFFGGMLIAKIILKWIPKKSSY